METQFLFEGKKYRVDVRACYFDSIIELPDDRYLRVTETDKSMSSIVEVEETSWDESVNVFDAIVVE